MNLWWLYTRHDVCNIAEVSSRSTIPFGWSEIGDISRYVKDRPNWERQFKAFIQVKGDLAYARDNSWLLDNRSKDKVPNLFWQFLQIKAGDIVVCIESGSQRTMGKPVIAGLGEVSKNAIDSYNFDNGYHFSHSVCSNTRWTNLKNWNKVQPIQMPDNDFFILCQDNSYLKQAQDMLIELNQGNTQKLG